MSLQRGGTIKNPNFPLYKRFLMYKLEDTSQNLNFFSTLHLECCNAPKRLTKNPTHSTCKVPKTKRKETFRSATSKICK